MTVAIDESDQKTVGKGRGRILFFAASAAVNAANFLFHILVSRSLGPDDYSALGALLALIIIAAVPLSALQLASAQAQARGDESMSLSRSLRASTLVGIGLCAALTLGAPVFDRALALHGYTLPALLGLWFGITTISAVPQGVLVGAERFKEVAVATFVGIGVARVAIGFAAGQAGGGVAGALTATVIGQVVTLALLLWPLRRRLLPSENQLRPMVSDGVRSVTALTGTAALAAIDDVVARSTLSSREAGYYVAAATAGRIALFVPGAIALIVFPRFSTAAEQGRSSADLLWRSAAIVTALALAAGGALSIAPHLVVDLLFGNKYKESADILPVMALSGAILGALNLFSYFHIAHRSWAAQIPWAGAALVLVGVQLRSSVDPRALAYTMLGITMACLLLSISVALLINPPATDAEVRVPALDIESGTLIPSPITRDVELG